MNSQNRIKPVTLLYLLNSNIGLFKEANIIREFKDFPSLQKHIRQPIYLNDVIALVDALYYFSINLSRTYSLEDIKATELSLFVATSINQDESYDLITKDVCFNIFTLGEKVVRLQYIDSFASFHCIDPDHLQFLKTWFVCSYYKPLLRSYKSPNYQNQMPCHNAEYKKTISAYGSPKSKIIHSVMSII